MLDMAAGLDEIFAQYMVWQSAWSSIFVLHHQAYHYT